MNLVHESELFERFAARGDTRALAELYDLVAPELLRVALHLARDPAQAEDLVQQTFVAAIEGAATFAAGGRIRGWLLGILANQARKTHRRDARRPEPAAEEGIDPRELAAANEFTAQVDAAIADLPQVYQPVLVLHLKHGLLAVEIAHALRRPPGTVRTQIVRGLELFRQALPPSLALGASALACTPMRGLAAVRAGVLAHARQHLTRIGPLAESAPFRGMLIMKKIAFAVALVLCTLVCVLVWPVPSGVVPAGLSGGDAALAPANTASAAPAASTAVVRDQVAAADAAGTHLVVTVLHADDCTPASGVGVWLDTAAGGPELAGAATDAGGQVAFTVGSADELCIRLDRSDAHLRLPGSTRAATLLLPPGALVRGRVIDRRHAPVAGARVFVTRDGVVRIPAACSAADGTFVMRDVAAGSSFTALAPGYASARVGMRFDGGVSEEVLLILADGGFDLSGEVVRADGLAVPHALVRVAVELDTAARYHEHGGTSSAVNLAHLLQTDQHGRFALPGLPPGRVRVAARAPGFAAATMPVVLPATGEVRLLLGPPAQVHGKVIGADGRGLADVRVEADVGTAPWRRRAGAAATRSPRASRARHRTAASRWTTLFPATFALRSRRRSAARASATWPCRRA